MNKKVDEKFKHIHDEYILQCTCTEMKDKINNLQFKINKAIKKLEYYNSGEALYYVPIQDIIDILKEDK